MFVELVTFVKTFENQIGYASIFCNNSLNVGLVHILFYFFFFPTTY